jgi:hypothetical protein
MKFAIQGLLHILQKPVLFITEKLAVVGAVRKVCLNWT